MLMAMRSFIEPPGFIAFYIDIGVGVTTNLLSLTIGVCPTASRIDGTVPGTISMFSLPFVQMLGNGSRQEAQGTVRQLGYFLKYNLDVSLSVRLRSL